MERYGIYTQLLVASTFTRITRARWMILVREKCRTNSPCEPNKRHLQNRARFNRACSEDLRLERKSRYPERCVSLFSALSLSLCFSSRWIIGENFVTGLNFVKSILRKGTKCAGILYELLIKKDRYGGLSILLSILSILHDKFIELTIIRFASFISGK